MARTIFTTCGHVDARVRNRFARLIIFNARSFRVSRRFLLDRSIINHFIFIVQFMGRLSGEKSTACNRCQFIQLGIFRLIL